MKKYEYTRILSNSSYEEIHKFADEGWRILLLQMYNGEECFLLERVKE